MILADFDQAPVIQTGPHAQLIADSQTFRAVLLCALGRAAANNVCAFWYGCSSVTLESRAKEGPGWLRIKGDLANVFGLPRKRLSRQSVFASKRQVEFVFQTASISAGKTFEKLSEATGGRCFPSPLDAFRTANELLWERSLFRDLSTLVFFSDELVSQLVADHIEDSTSPVAELVFSPLRRAALENAISRVSRSPMATFLPWGTDYFWFVRDGRIRATAIKDGRLIEKLTGETLFPLTPDAVVAGLRNGYLICNLFLTFLALSVLPGVRVLGGPLQVAYYPIFNRLLCEILDIGRATEAELRSELTRSTLHGWGMSVIESGGPRLASFFSSASAANVLFDAQNITLARASRDLAAFNRDSKWNDYIRYADADRPRCA